MNKPETQSGNGPGGGTVRPVDWKDFREHLATADRDGSRRWIHARQPSGPIYRVRVIFSWLLILVMFAGPFVRIGGNPLLLMNIVERRFVILGQIFWPQDAVIFAVAMLLFLTGILIFTSAFGRLWCGWTCPQTVMMEMVFRRLEWWIEGDAHKQRALDRAPWSAGKLARKGFKHVVFFGISFLIGNTLLSYIIGSEQLFQIITDPPSQHVQGLVFMVLFTLVFYAIFARFREQACTFICPYGRFQSVLLDENSIVVAYDYKRGEGRGPLRRGQTPEVRKAAGKGDCVDCNACVTVCPTGIDIRNGIQMECVNCTACIDACNGVMARLGRPPGLVGYKSLNGIEKGDRLRVTPRLVGYTVVLGLLGLLLGFLIFTRAPVETILLRAPGSLFQQAGDGRISNLYLMKVVNKTSRKMPVSFQLDSPRGELQVMGLGVEVPPQKLSETSVLVTLPRSELQGSRTPVVVGVYAGGKRIQTLRTVFVGPHDPVPSVDPGSK